MVTDLVTKRSVDKKGMMWISSASERVRRLGEDIGSRHERPPVLDNCSTYDMFRTLVPIESQ